MTSGSPAFPQTLPYLPEQDQPARPRIGAWIFRILITALPGGR